MNTPIQEGFALSTWPNSFAEVEFENGSTARLGELSKVDFTQTGHGSGRGFRFGEQEDQDARPNTVKTSRSGNTFDGF